MKKTMRLNMLKSVALLFLLAGSFISCEKEEDDMNATIVLVTQGMNTVNLSMDGTGKVTIDWGDGKRETRQLYTYADLIFDENNGLPVNNDIFEYRHFYPYGNRTHTIKIVGNVTNLTCNGQRITSVSVSNNTRLFYLDVQNNYMSAIALNSLFETLPSRIAGIDGIQGTDVNIRSEVFIDDNPGTYLCDRSIARNKGWFAVSQPNINPEIDPIETCPGKWEWYLSTGTNGEYETHVSPTGYLELLPDGYWGWYDYEMEEYFLAEGKYWLDIFEEWYIVEWYITFEHNSEDYFIYERLRLSLYGNKRLHFIDHNTMLMLFRGGRYSYCYFSRIS